jgi:RNA polymerase-interacting CarD/CdnL/TRCF family regulator
MAIALRLGEKVVVPGEGAGTILTLDATNIGIALPGESLPSLLVPRTSVDLLRAPMSRAEAAATLARLCTPVDAEEARTVPQLRSSREARRLELDAQVELLRLRHRAPKRLFAHEDSYLDAAAKSLFPELAVALGVAIHHVVSAVRLGENLPDSTG